MSLKENVDYIKKEVSAEESFIENFFKVEKFYKKYKAIIFGIVGLVVVAFVGMGTMDYLNEKNKMEANELFNTLLENPNDKNSLAKLKEKNQKLYEIIVFKNTPTENVNMEFLKELSAYSKAIEKGELSQITKVSQENKFLLKEFAIFNKALIQAQNGKFVEAKESLKFIPENSSISGLSKMLEHYLLTK